MKYKSRLKIGLIIAGIIAGIVLIITTIFLIFKINNKKVEITYEDVVTGKNYFLELKIDLNEKKVYRDNEETTLSKEFDISEDHERILLNSSEELTNYLNQSCFNISVDKNVYKINNPYQTKCFFIQSNEVPGKVEGQDIIKLSDDLFLLSFKSEKLTKAMYESYKSKNSKIYLDEVYINEKLNDVSQTMYGETQVDLKGNHVLGTTTMALDNYKNIINENGNPNNVVIATIGYGADITNDFIKNRINENYYNFILNNKTIEETIPQGSRIIEVLADATTDNISIMPLVTVTEDGYTSLSSNVKALCFAIENSDVICYELINEKNEIFNIILQNAFTRNIPICSVAVPNKNIESNNVLNANNNTSADTNSNNLAGVDNVQNNSFNLSTNSNSTSDKKTEDNSNDVYPASDSKTIAVASLDREMKPADYSAKGDYIDFAAPSTDIEEIFKKTSTVSRWSGPQYSNASIAASIALVKSYNKNSTIRDIYTFLLQFVTDLGNQGKDNEYGYGVLNFSNLKISDIDKQTPVISETVYENETWEVVKQIKIVASDNIRVRAWTITRSAEIPKDTEWKVLENVTSNLDITSEILENGPSYIWVQDSAQNLVFKEIQIDKVDNIIPKIAYTIDKNTLNQGYATIQIKAEDNESGLDENAYSWDKNAWSQENATRVIKQNGRFKIYVKDKLGNIAEKEILVDFFPQTGTAEVGEGNIISAIDVSAFWNGETNSNVKIVLNKDIDITGWQITADIYVPNSFVEVPPENTNNLPNNTGNNTSNSQNINLPNNVVINSSNTSNQTTQNTVIQQYVPRIQPIEINKPFEANIIYYLWIKDSQGRTKYQQFKILKPQI